MRGGSFTRCHLEEEIFFSDEIPELINLGKNQILFWIRTHGLIFGGVNSPWVSCISTCLKNRDTDCPMSQTFFQGCVYIQQPWKVKRVSLSIAKGVLTDHYIWIPYIWDLSPITQHTTCTCVTWPSSYLLVESGSQQSSTKNADTLTPAITVSNEVLYL